MGVSYTYNRIIETRVGNFMGLENASSVWEFFYNIELTPAIHLTVDAQLVESVRPNLDTAAVLGSRLNIRF